MVTKTNIKFVDLKQESIKDKALQFKITRLGSEQTPRYSSINDTLNKRSNGVRLTKIVLSSLTLNNEDIKDIVGIEHYESRALWEILQASEKNLDVIYVSSIPINKMAIKHLINSKSFYKELLSKVQFVYLDDHDNTKSLTEKLLSNKERLNEFKSLIPRDSYISSFISSELEWELAQKLNIPLLGPGVDLKYFQGKSGNRQVFTQANIPHADGINNIVSINDLVSALDSLWKRNEKSKRLVVKLDFGVSGNGNALLKINENYKDFYKLSESERHEKWLNKLPSMQFQSQSIDWDFFKARIPEGTIVELFIEGEKKTSPSSQGFIHPDGRVEILSTHEQILNENGFTFLGCIFPANQFRRKVLQEYTYKVGLELKEKGIIGPFAVDYLVSTTEVGTQIWAIEINVRQGGTTHPYQTAKYLTDSIYNNHNGILETKNGQSIYYRSNDNVVNSNLVGKNIEDLLSYVDNKGLLFTKETNSGVVFHLLGALKDYGKVGYTAIGTTRTDVNKLDQLIQACIEDFCSND